ncbi:MAG: peptidylprolyl isomerase, partial [Nitrospirae bacterium GWC2_56_14]
MKNAFMGFIGLLLLSGLCQAAEKKELKNETEKINYSVGYQIGGDFKSQGVELDPDALVQGIQDALKKNKPLLSQELMNATLVDLKKKIVADQQSAAKITAEENRKASAAFLTENAKQKGVTVLPSGVQYKVLKEGSGKKPTLKDDVKIHYRITKIDGKEIGNTYVGGKPRTSPVAKAMPGLQEVLLLMKEGSKWQIFLPTATASGGREP